MNIDYAKAKQIVAGASVFSTGGGFEYSAQLKKLAIIFSANQELILKQLTELNDDDYICTAYGVGSAANTDVDLSRPLELALAKIQEITNKKFVGIFAGETNIEALVFQIAKASGLPIVDADCTGGRAVPEIQFDNLFVAGKNILPLVAVTMQGESKVLTEASSPAEVESFVRNIALESGDSVAVVDHPMSVRDAKQYLTAGIFVRSLKLGELIDGLEQPDINKIIKYANGRLLMEGIVEEVQLQDAGGFLAGKLTIKSDTSIASIVVKNENMVLEIDGKLVLTIPDLITLIDTKTGLGIHNSKIQIGQKVCIVAIPATELWRSEAGQKRFSPTVLGLEYPVQVL